MYTIRLIMNLHFHGQNLFFETIMLIIYVLKNSFLCKQELENPLILIHEKKISDVEALSRVLEIGIKVNKVHSIKISVHAYDGC